MTLLIAIFCGSVVTALCLMAHALPKSWTGWAALIGFVCGLVSQVAWILHIGELLAAVR